MTITRTSLYSSLQTQAKAVNPSQLGIEEVENANAYDVYKLDENGEPVLYTTVSSQQASRMRMSVKRELKLFNLVVKE